MGIDIYAKWKGQSEIQVKRQVTGFNIHKGHVGYLREAYHGKPYATHFFVAEAFEAENGEAKIPAKTLIDRLPKTLALVRERATGVYHQNDYGVWEDQKAFVDFALLCQRMEKKTGEPVTIQASY